MKQIKRNLSLLSLKRWVSIHDAKLTQIVCADNSVEFHFAKGFAVIDGNNMTQTKSGYIELTECNSDDFFCLIFNRKASRKGIRLRGKSISLLELAQMLE